MSLTSRSKRDVLVGVTASAALVVASAAGALPFTRIEVAGFVTGGIAVWMLVRENVWNWPIGIANSAIYFVVFVQARLFADGALQLAFIVLGFAGWWWWIQGRTAAGRCPVVRVAAVEALVVASTTAACAYALTRYLQSVGDSAPFLDASTTCLSLAATYLQARKVIESWLVWIAADLIYIPLYAAKGLPLTSLLYVAFLAMCVKGLLEWRATLERQVERRATTYLAEASE